MDGIASVFRYYADLADKNGGETNTSPIPNTISKTVREPVGVCGQITPWNYPLLQASWKLAPALVAGNTLVMKPSEITPLTTIKVFELMRSEEHTSELQSRGHLVCRLLLEKKNK